VVACGRLCLCLSLVPVGYVACACVFLFLFFFTGYLTGNATPVKRSPFLN